MTQYWRLSKQSFCMAFQNFGGHLRQRVDVNDEVEMVVAVQERAGRQDSDAGDFSLISEAMRAAW
jgi:hypothetical protein